MFDSKTVADVLGVPLRGESLTFQKISQNSHSVEPSDLFVAIKGERFDGHQFLPDVFKKGCRGAIVQKGKSLERKYPRVQFFEVQEPTKALGDLACSYRKRFQIPLVALTGSNGKTTTKDLLAHLLSGPFSVLKTEGNQNNLIGLPFTLLRLTAAHTMAVCELGMSLPFEIKRLSEIALPTGGLITNIGDTHLLTMKSRDQITKAKGELFLALHKDQIAFVNLDDPYLASFAKKLRCQVITYSLKNKEADVVGKILENKGIRGSRIHISGRKGVSFDCDLALPGEHNAANAVAAMTVAIHFGVSIEKMKESLRTFEPTKGRSQTIPLSGDKILIDDSYNANPSSVRQALTLLSAYPGKTYAVLADMLELVDKEILYHQEIGALCSSLKIDNLLTLGPLSQYSVARAKELSFPVKTFSTEDREELIHKLKQILKNETRAAILVKGSRGMKMDLVVEALKKEFFRTS